MDLYDDDSSDSDDEHEEDVAQRPRRLQDKAKRYKENLAAPLFRNAPITTIQALSYLVDYKETYKPAKKQFDALLKLLSTVRNMGYPSNIYAACDSSPLMRFHTPCTLTDTSASAQLLTTQLPLGQGGVGY